MGKINKVTFIPAVDFTGFPVNRPVQFKADVTSIPVDESFAELMRDKGLVKPGTHFTPVEEPKDTK